MSDVAGALGIEVQYRADLPAPARWHRVRAQAARQPALWEDASISSQRDLILLRSDLPETARRFALAHEIGHAVLQRNREALPKFDRCLPLDSALEERYANAFAGELLLPTHRIYEIRAQFRSATNPLELLRLASLLGVSPQMLLVRAERDRWMSGLDGAWLDIRVAPNQATGLDRRARIHRVALDTRRWLLPANRSIAGALGDDTWLTGLDKNRDFRGEIDISYRTRDSRPRWVHVHVPAHVTARRLRARQRLPAIDFLAYVAIDATPLAVVPEQVGPSGPLIWAASPL